MRVFACPHCAHVVQFESTSCVNCGTALAYDPVARTIARADGGAGAPCANALVAACNWLAPAPGALCASCRFTRTRPADGDAAGLAGFALVEGAKRRLLFELSELELPLARWDERDGGLGFDLLSSAYEPVVTGHADGIVTIDLAEADPVHRERLRVQLGEPYRTLLGHLRHEVGHWYQTVLVAPGSEREEACRRLFGDERADYQAAMSRHYAEGPPAGWREQFVSAYATMHPWEDWAETFAHYLHVNDALQTAAAWGVRVSGPPSAVTSAEPLQSDPADAERGGDLSERLEAWIPLTLALNAVNRSMGVEDLYPFVLGPAVQRKLTFVDQLVRAGTPRGVHN
ncbi:putative zinc-binding metallopeptidase [Conexibacter sp. JD483]|uniref:zinc-binding metallopeptidase family protein n=1 Tax=unclassified Conexibacter TaxID=2627773 RepID=UPI0027258865|nr:MULTISPECIES: putative zinc-binding metallopeptidase [unclassified Conexibacter]MDO8185642.1 putative zinc-binding metallopeptidase [Conexibacter sp. CPCC 205706]MDO8198815.1 putative zinc-binding metallopeptidase [Conexibacter sp. CPCC 205762]MDR9367835.1 putative zinc-binding metallopeptidase [Conexibacter sp. JD483]